MYNASSFVALDCVLIMFVVSVGSAENNITCSGVKHLVAGRYTVSNCTDCTIVGEPGTIIEGPILCNGSLNLNGSVALEGKGQPECVSARYPYGVAFNGNVEVSNCHNMNGRSQAPVTINGGEAGQSLVSIKNSSTASYVPVHIAHNARVTIVDSKLPTGNRPYLPSLHITDSYVSFERVATYVEYDGYYFTNSTVIATNTSFDGGHPDFVAKGSTLNFTRSRVSFFMGNWFPGISISNCTVDVTCDAAGAVFRTGMTNAGSMGMDIIQSNVHFERCSCHLERAISVQGPLSVQKSSVTFGSCQNFGVLTEGHESMPVAV